MKPLTMHTADIPTRDSKGRTVMETRPVYLKDEADARIAEFEAECDAARAEVAILRELVGDVASMPVDIDAVIDAARSKE